MIKEKMKTKDFLTGLFFVLGAIGVGSIGTIFTASAIPSWYVQLVKPAFNPPNYLFGPVWTVLFATLGIAAFLVWRKGWENPKVKSALVVFAIQFILNVAWSFLFFGLQNPFLGLVEIGLLWVFIALTIWKFYQISKPAGLLLLPYILWVTFATVLNFYIWKLN